MKKIAILMVLAVVLSIGAAYAAAPGDASNSTWVDLGAYSQASSDTADVLGGNIYTSTISTSASTVRWAGLYGNVSGDIVLGDGTGNLATDTMYTWSGAKGLVVYATNSSSPTWTSVSAASNASVLADYPFLSEANAPNDNFGTATFSATHALNSNLFTVAAPSAVQTENGADTPTWWTMALTDSSGAIIWAAEVIDGATETAYDGAGADYQMLLPDSSVAEDTTATVYDLYLELE